MPVPGQAARVLARYLRRQVRAYSDAYRASLDGLFRELGGRSGIDLTRMGPTEWSAVAQPRDYVLHPEYSTISRYGDPWLGVRVLWARLTGRTAALNRTVIDPMYKPLLWVMADGVPIGYSHRDLDRLAELGRGWLERAGVRPSDVVVSVVPPAPTLGYWELVLASRRAGLSAVFLPAGTPVAQVARLRPTVLAGRPDDLERLLGGPPEDLAGVHTVLAVDQPLAPGQRERLAAGVVHPDAAVLEAWGPPGTRSLWTECRGGTGLHTAPSAEVIEVVDGEVLWTALDWSGTVFVRLRTGVAASATVERCPACEVPGVRLSVESTAPTSRVEEMPLQDEVAFPREEQHVENGTTPAPFAQVLDAHPGVAAWQAELRTVNGEEELLVFFSPGSEDAVAVLGDIAADVDAVQFVVLTEAEVLDRLARHDKLQVVDRR